MALSSGTYTHREHVKALRASLSLDPMGSPELKALVDLSLGREADRNTLSMARSHLSAPSRPSAFYSALALHLFDDPLRLSEPEVEAIRLLASGADTREIGESFGHSTEASQRNRGAELLRMARGKLGAESNTHLIRMAYRVRLIEPSKGSPPLPPWT
ncbi:MAG: hypothetical protein IH953_02760 [Chloroflexi bacterium]|nr:hypothetical protein [Chloroflexota bacterium]